MANSLHHTNSTISTACNVTTIYILCLSLTIHFRSGCSSDNVHQRHNGIDLDNETMINDAMIEQQQQQQHSYYYEEEDDEQPGAFLGDAVCCGSHFDSFREGGNLCGIPTDYCSNGPIHNTTVIGDAFDIIIVESQDGDLFQNSPFLVKFPQKYSSNSYKIVLEIDNMEKHERPGFSKAWFPVTSSRISGRIQYENGGSDNSNHLLDEKLFSTGMCPEELARLNRTITTAATSTTTTATNEDGRDAIATEHETNKLKPFLNRGRNSVRYLLLDQVMSVIGVAKANVFLWNHHDSVIISDIDGTITKSNTRGAIDTIITAKYQHVHHNICNLLHQLASHPNTQIVYVTSRPLSLATSTRRFLDHVRQEDQNLPVGPILGFSGKFPELLLMEVVTKTTHHFKSEILWQQVVRPFQRAKNDQDCKIFKAGFGNTVMDMQAYHAVGMDVTRIFKINKRSEIATFDKVLATNASEDETSCLMLPTIKGKNNDSTHSITLRFQPRKWFKERMGTMYSGYDDPKLLALLVPPV